ncbi:MAG: YjjG family noncanonical pyrimidine nucleotidase [Ruminococcus sp.]|nr:YjjG family noncanonical pyrimidine nucleotidase [Candidatus Apopatosoma intestinale]
MLKAILIDVDNTLLSFDGYVRESMKNGFAAFGLPPYREEMFDTFTRINNGLWKQIERGELTLPELRKVRWNRIFAELGIDFDGACFEEYFFKSLYDSAIPEPGAMDLLRVLHGRHTLCVASNGPYAQQVNRLRVGGMLPFFDHLFISEEIGAQKPSAAFFEACIHRINEKETVLPEEILMIGDSLSSDMAGCPALGIRTCFYNPKGKDVPKEPKLDYVISHLHEIESIL